AAVSEPALERDIVIELVAPRPACRSDRLELGPLASAALGGRSARACACARACSASAEHLHLVRDDLGGVPLDALLVLPLARAQAPLDVDLRALVQVLGGDLREPIEHHDPVPFGALLLLARLTVLPALAGRDVDIAHARAGGHGARLGIAAEIADEDDFVYSACHDFTPSSRSMERYCSRA